jgi:glycosyltransferase involved in cell wall biosynthesis
MHYYANTYNLLYTYYLAKFLITDPQYYFSKLIMSPSVSEDFKKIYNLETTVIPTGIDLNNFKFSDNKRENILLYIGRLAPEKNIDKLIKMFKSINNYKLFIIGYGPEESKLKELAKDNNNIIFLGKKDHGILPYYYQIARAHITLSESETFGLTLLESLSCGTPIIYSNCQVFTTLYEKDFGELCLTNNNTLQNIINYIELNEKELQIKCKNYSEQHSWSQATDKLIDIYNTIS